MAQLQPALNAGHQHEAHGFLLADVHDVHEAVDDMHGDRTVISKLGGVLRCVEGHLQVVDHDEEAGFGDHGRDGQGSHGFPEVSRLLMLVNFLELVAFVLASVKHKGVVVIEHA